MHRFILSILLQVYIGDGKYLPRKTLLPLQKYAKLGARLKLICEAMWPNELHKRVLHKTKFVRLEGAVEVTDTECKALTSKCTFFNVHFVKKKIKTNLLHLNISFSSRNFAVHGMGR